jgi:hypothetical protein
VSDTETTNSGAWARGWKSTKWHAFPTTEAPESVCGLVKRSAIKDEQRASVNERQQCSWCRQGVRAPTSPDGTKMSASRSAPTVGSETLTVEIVEGRYDGMRIALTVQHLGPNQFHFNGGTATFTTPRPMPAKE